MYKIKVLKYEYIVGDDIQVQVFVTNWWLTCVALRLFIIKSK
jgi:hypothetical protein